MPTVATSLENVQYSLRFQANPLLNLFIERAIQTTKVQIDSHGLSPFGSLILPLMLLPLILLQDRLSQPG